MKLQVQPIGSHFGYQFTLMARLRRSDLSFRQPPAAINHPAIYN